MVEQNKHGNETFSEKFQIRHGKFSIKTQGYRYSSYVACHVIRVAIPEPVICSHA